MKNKKALIVNILIPVGALSAFLTRNSMDVCEKLVQPPLSPPSWVFPDVWTILFILMGISSYLIYISDPLPALGILCGISELRNLLVK